MRNKSNKMIKLERNRYSILTDDLKHCYICKSENVDIHEIYGGHNRRQSMKFGFCIPLCRKHHTSVTFDVFKALELKIKCQEKFEETDTRDNFIKIIGRNYLA